MRHQRRRRPWRGQRWGAWLAAAFLCLLPVRPYAAEPPSAPAPPKPAAESGGKRVIISPDCLGLVGGHRHVTFYIYVPKSTESFILSVFDQDTDVIHYNPRKPASGWPARGVPVSVLETTAEKARVRYVDPASKQPVEAGVDPGELQETYFSLYDPDAAPEFIGLTREPAKKSLYKQLDEPKDKGWSDYVIDCKGKPGVWRLLAHYAGKDFSDLKSETKYASQNFFKLQTVGDVDLYAQPGRPGPSVPTPFYHAPDLFLSAPKFSTEARDTLYLEVPPWLDKFTLLLSAHWTGRIGVFRPDGRAAPASALQPGDTQVVEVGCKGHAGVWRLEISDYGGQSYNLSTAEELRIFFAPPKFASLPDRAELVITTMEESGSALPCRVSIYSEGRKFDVAFTDVKGQAVKHLPPGRYECQATRGPRYEPSARAEVELGNGSQEGSVSLKVKQLAKLRRGWYAGDLHLHTLCRDGRDTVAEMLAAALADGCDWAAITDHLGYDNEAQVEATAKLAAATILPNLFIGLPGVEFSCSNHVSVIGLEDAPDVPASADKKRPAMRAIVEEALKQNSPEWPVYVQANHPFSEAVKDNTAPQEIPAAPGLHAVEGLLSSLLVQELNKGRRLAMAWNSDSHSRMSVPVGARNYCFVGGQFNRVGLLNALRAGRSFVSDGPLLYVLINDKMPGETVTVDAANKLLRVLINVNSPTPLLRVDLLRNGEVLAEFAGLEQTSFAQLYETEALPKQSWYVVHAHAEGGVLPPGAPPKARRQALTNPIYVQAP